MNPAAIGYRLFTYASGVSAHIFLGMSRLQPVCLLPAVFFFYPLDFTFVCPTEIVAFSDAVEEFRKIGAEVSQLQGPSIDKRAHPFPPQATSMSLCPWLTLMQAV